MNSELLTRIFGVSNFQFLEFPIPRFWAFVQGTLVRGKKARRSFTPHFLIFLISFFNGFFTLSQGVSSDMSFHVYKPPKNSLKKVTYEVVIQRKERFIFTILHVRLYLLCSHLI